MKTKNKIDDNKTLRAQSTKELLAAAISIGKATLTEREYSILEDVLVNQKTFRELGESLQLTRSRVKAIFQNGEKRLNNLFKGIHKRVTSYDALENELKEAEKKLAELQITVEKESKISPELKALLATPISDLDFSARLLGVCVAAEISTVGDLVKFSKIDFLRMRNFGGKTMRELEDFLASKKISLGMKL